jgi:competence protein ComEA
VYAELVQRDGNAVVYRMGPEARIRDLFRAAGEPIPGTIDGTRRLASGERLVLEPTGGWSSSWMPGDRLIALGLPVRLNDSVVSDLRAVPGISEQVALRIVLRRHEIGRFQALSDLEDIPGIGPETLKILARYTLP